MSEAVEKLSNGGITFTSSADCIKFSSGSRIMSLPSGNPSALRGFTSTATIIDEAAFIENPSDVFAAITPTLTRDPNAELILASTPAGQTGTFYDIWINDDESWYKQLTTIDDAIEDGLKVNIEELIKLTPDPEVFDQEYRCKFSSEYGAFIDTTLLDFCYPNFDAGKYYCGIDFGRKNDGTVVSILKVSYNKIYLEDIVTM
jgi:phage FluMu gp28-like protein